MWYTPWFKNLIGFCGVQLTSKLLDSMLGFGEFEFWFRGFFILFGLGFWADALFCSSRKIGTISLKSKYVPFLVSAYANAHLWCCRHFCLRFFQRNPPFILPLWWRACPSHARLFWETRQEQWAQTKKCEIPSEHKKKLFYCENV